MQIRRRRYDRTVLAPGQMLQGQDTYCVGQVIGEGGYAVVYEATSSKALPVAVKEFVPGATVQERDQVHDLYMRERDVLWRLRQHPNLPDLIEAFSQHGMYYLAFEFIQGDTLRERLKRQGPIPPAEAGPLILQLARALAALHAYHVVHHDVKPDNVVLSTSGLAMLLDLGSARFAGPSQESSQQRPLDARSQSLQASSASQVAGTDGYMAPELLEMVQKGCLVSQPALDVFAFGCTADELLTNRRLRQSEIDGRNAATISEAIREIEKCCPELVVPVAHALCLDVDGRYPSAQELLAVLEQVVPPQPAVRPHRLDFDLSGGQQQVERSLVVHNAGGGTLTGSVHCLHPALFLRQPDGTPTKQVALEGNLTAVGVVATSAGVPAGKQVEGQIVVRSARGELPVPCAISRIGLQPIELAAGLSQVTLLVTSEMMQQVWVKVRNKGGEAGRIFVERPPASLVDVIPSEAHLLPGSAADFCLRPVISRLRPGVHTTTILFRSESGESRAPVQVIIRVRGQP
jgi:serine/threonine protein kinase